MRIGHHKRLKEHKTLEFKAKWMREVLCLFREKAPDARPPTQKLLKLCYNNGFDVETTVTKAIEALEPPVPIKWEPAAAVRGGTAIHAYRIDKGHEGALCLRKPASGWKDMPGRMVDCDGCMAHLVRMELVKFEEDPEPLVNTLAHVHWLEDGGA